VTKNFALIGVAGYIAPRHLKAIADTGNRLVAATDPNDSVGVLDRHWFDVRFFPEIERFDRHVEKLRRAPDADRVHYVSICSPNYLHDAHMRLALRVGADAICEKPLVINPWNLDQIQEIEKETGRKVNTVLQLRVHPSLLEMKKRLDAEDDGRIHDVVLTYITGRGPWYHVSWKGREEKSGGLATNIGIHFFDALIWLFGDVKDCEVHLSDRKVMAGCLVLERARVRWLLSVDIDRLPYRPKPGEPMTHRSMTVDGEEVEFSTGFTDLHTLVYQHILEGKGFGTEDARASIELAYRIRQTRVTEPGGERGHPNLRPR
jgi:UDP-N-acetyl-2-amino-2-deoxyglucuronate dehydrogenase